MTDLPTYQPTNLPTYMGGARDTCVSKKEREEDKQKKKKYEKTKTKKKA